MRQKRAPPGLSTMYLFPVVVVPLVSSLGLCARASVFTTASDLSREEYDFIVVGGEPAPINCLMLLLTLF